MNVNILCFKGLKLFCFDFKQLKTILSFIRTRLSLSKPPLLLLFLMYHRARYIIMDRIPTKIK